MDFSRASLGIEFGSTRIKAVLIDETHTPVASGSHLWENKLEDGVWTYSIDDIHNGLQSCFAALKADVRTRLGVPLTTVGSMGVSGMMHGYMAFDDGDRLLVPFRTWRNNTTQAASARLSKEFGYPIPERWSIAHLYQAVLDAEPHVSQVAHITTLAGYVHYMLTGERVLGIGEASGMFPIDVETRDYNRGMMDVFERLVEGALDQRLCDLLPKVKVAGETAGRLTQSGALLLDPSGELKSGVPLCPPEGDAGTGMVSTNSVAKKTANVSAGTSIFLMAVLEKQPQNVHSEIDLVTTPSGNLVAMVHCNNCTGDLDAWVSVFAEFAELSGGGLAKSALYDSLYNAALSAEADCGGLVAYNYISGENITGVVEGRPMLVRAQNSRFTLANLMRAHIYSALCTLRIGYDILLSERVVELCAINGHGGLFKTEHVGQRLMAAALETPVTVMENAGEGGPWGMAILAAYMRAGAPVSLEAYIGENIFKSFSQTTCSPCAEDVLGFSAYLARYKQGLGAQKSAAEIQ